MGDPHQPTPADLLATARHHAAKASGSCNKVSTVTAGDGITTAEARQALTLIDEAVLHAGRAAAALERYVEVRAASASSRVPRSHRAHPGGEGGPR